MNRIILIGNGFDLAHGLKTSYADFISDFWMGKVRKFVDEMDMETFDDGDIRLCNAHTVFERNGYPLSKGEHCNRARFQIKKMIPQWEKKGWKLEEFEAALKTNGVAIFYYNNFLDYISQNIERKAWIDIEEEYFKQMSELVRTSRGTYERIEYINKCFKRIKSALKSYLDRVINKKVVCATEIEHNIYNDIEINDITNIGIEGMKKMELSCQKDNICQPTYTLFLNFNYSHTEQGYLNSEKQLEVLHIHGELNNPHNPIIFGYGDDIGDNYLSIEKTNDNRFLENVKSIRYLETDNYKRLLNFVESELYQVCVFGHSCGISDRTLLNTLFEHKNCVSIKVFYHQKEDGTDNYSDVVRNISRSFTDKAAMREKVVNKAYCKPLKGKSQQE
jgi:hypothetical protein